MRESRLFRRYYLLTVFIVLTFIVVGFVASRLALRAGTVSSRAEGRHFVLYAKLLDRLETNGSDVTSRRRRALSEIYGGNLAAPKLHLALLDESGSVLGPADTPIPFQWDQIEKPDVPYEFVPIGDRAERRELRGLIRLPGHPIQYLYTSYERPENGFRHSPFFLWTLGSMIISVLIGVLLSMGLIFRALRERAKLADGVLAEMQQGNLKARFPIGKMDEIGQAMSRFNRMADEIERLVEQLKGTEKSRMKLLQELAHDLRTPVASQKNLLETLITKGDGVAPSLRHELLSLTLTEVEYFERLIEDLLVLAQVSEPRYRMESERVVLNDLVREEAENMAISYSTAHAGDRKIGLKDRISVSPLAVHGDSHLLRRMVRNALSNAFSFARGEVSVQLDRDSGGAALIAIEDDGEGFSREALASFGTRRITRELGAHRKGKLSVGLGSVILKTVAEIHGGSIRVRNRESDSRVVGGRVEIILPLT